MGRPIPDLDGAVQDRDCTFREIDSIVRDLFGPRATVRAIAVERLERRLLRYAVELASGRQWVVIGKVYGSAAEGQHGFDTMRQLWQAGFSEQPPVNVHIPRVYRYLPDIRLLLMEQAPGEALRNLVKRKVAGDAEMKWLAAALAKLHRSPLVFGEPCTVEHHLVNRCAGLHAALAAAFPELGDRVRWIVETARTLEMRSDAAPTVSHGDFHLGQLHIHDSGAWILDLDPLHIGDPAYDIAMVFTMLKHLEQRTGDAAYIRSLRDAFADAYFSEGGYDRAARVPVHMALIHLKRACKRFRWQDQPGWPETIHRQLGEGAACIEAAVRLVSVPRCRGEIASIYDSCPATV